MWADFKCREIKQPILIHIAFHEDEVKIHKYPINFN